MKVALGLLALLAVVALLVRFGQATFAFFPVSGETATPADMGLPYVTLSIPTADGANLRAWAMTHAAPHAHIVYFHGNGGNLSIWAPILAGIARQGYSVLAVDYRGYGSSTGRPSERGLYRDVDAVVARFWTESPKDLPVVYWGRSLGASMAAYGATVRPPDGVILESAFPDVRSLMRSSPPMALLSLFSSYRFPAVEFMQRVTVPVLVMHGDSDRVVPFTQGQALFEKIPGTKSFFTIRGGDHNDATAPDQSAYWKAVADFIARL